MFKGHNFVKITSGDWVFDITEFIGYKINIDNNNRVIGYNKAFTANIDEDNEVVLNKVASVPIKILKETKSVINRYRQLREG